MKTYGSRSETFFIASRKETNPERNLGQISPSTPRLASVRQAQIPPKTSLSGNGDADLPESQNPFTLRGNAEISDETSRK
jgi:hypothetical protein